MPSTRHSWTVDSIEEGIAAVEEDGARMLRLPLSLLPTGAREGDVLSVLREEEGGAVVLTVRADPEGTARALARSRAQVEGTPPGNDPGGHIVL